MRRKLVAHICIHMQISGIDTLFNLLLTVLRQCFVVVLTLLFGVGFLLHFVLPVLLFNILM